MDFMVIHCRDITIRLTEEIYKMLEKRSVMFGLPIEVVASTLLACEIYRLDPTCAEDAKEFQRGLLILQAEHAERQKRG